MDWPMRAVCIPTRRRPMDGTPRSARYERSGLTCIAKEEPQKGQKSQNVSQLFSVFCVFAKRKRESAQPDYLPLISADRYFDGARRRTSSIQFGTILISVVDWP